MFNINGRFLLFLLNRNGKGLLQARETSGIPNADHLNCSVRSRISIAQGPPIVGVAIF